MIEAYLEFYSYHWLEYCRKDGYIFRVTENSAKLKVKM